MMRAVAAVVAMAVGPLADWVPRLLVQPTTDGAERAIELTDLIGSGIAVAALAYLARLMASGKLVSRDPAASEAAMTGAAKQLADLTAASQTLTREAHERERELMDMLRAGYVAQSVRRPRRAPGGE